MTQTTSDPGRTGGRPLDGRKGPAVCILGAALVAHAILIPVVLRPLKGMDFFTMYVCARVPMTGRSPYETGAVDYENPIFRDAARAHFRLWGIEGKIPVGLNLPHGLFYPPQAYLILTPFSRLPWHAALVCWTVFTTLAVLACGSLTWTFDSESRGRSPTVVALVVAAFLLNPITAYHFSLLQSTILMCAGVALGQRASRGGHFWLAAFFWSFAAIKPQNGVELCALTLLAGGWRFCAATALVTVGLNILGGLVTTGDPLMMLGMWKGGYAHAATSIYNTARSEAVVSWVRDVYLLTGREIAMTPVRIIAGHLLWLGTVLGAAWLRGGLRWALSYWVAVAAAGSLVFGLTHVYDLVMLILLVPYMFWLYDRGWHHDWVVLAALMVVAAVPKGLMRALHVPGLAGEVLISHRAVVVLILAVFLLVRGQPGGAAGPRAGESDAALSARRGVVGGGEVPE